MLAATFAERSSWLRAIFDGNRLYLDHQVRM
jgi:hypothetical protein